MGHDHVAVGAGVLVEARTVVDGERLGDVDLHVVDVVAVPHRLEHAVGEAQRDEVLHGLAAEEVVDPEDPLLREDAVDERIQRARALEVGAERLLQHDPRAVSQLGGPERGDDVAERARRDRQVVQASRVPTQLALGARHRRLQRLGLLGAEGGERQPLREALPRLAGRLADRIPRHASEILVGAALARGADDLVAGGHEPGAVEVEQTGQQLAPAEIAQRAEEDDDVVVGDQGAV